MTVENTKYMDYVKNSENDTVYFDIDNEQNSENIYPLGGELMVAIRPLISNCNIPLISKININKTNELNVKCGKEVLSNSNNISSPVKRSNIELNLNNLSSPVKRSIDTIDNHKQVPKSFLSLSPRPTTPTYPLIQQLSHSVDSSNLQTALKHVQARDHLSQSCFAEITSEKGNSDIDSELTCLNWLQEANLLKEFSPGKRKSKSCDEQEVITDAKGCNEDLKLDTKDPLSCAINDVDKSLRKPAYSFSTLIFMAIESSITKRLPVKDIYQWIQDKFPYFQRAAIGWKNSIRHNLSLNKSFKKVDKEKCIGKGSLWMIDHQARAGLVQQLRKTSMCVPYPKTSYNANNGCGKYFLKDKKLHRRDATGRFVPNHDDAEFDVAAAMCSLSSSAALIDYEKDYTQTNGFDFVSSEELLQRWRTCIEPNNHCGGNIDGDHPEGESRPFILNNRNCVGNSKYTIEDFVDEVHSKLSFRSPHNSASQVYNGLDSSFNVSMDEDYEFDKSDDESSDEEMRENMIRLVERENDECLADSGYSEEGTLKNATILDHSYSRSVQSLVRPHSKREAKGVDALLHLANLASRELENLNNMQKNKMDSSIDFSSDFDSRNLRCSESPGLVLTAEKSCQYDSPTAVVSP